MADHGDQKNNLRTLFSRLSRRREELCVSTQALGVLNGINVIKSHSLVRWVTKLAFKVCATSVLAFALSFAIIYRFHWPISRFTMFWYLSVITQQDIYTGGCFLPMDFTSSNTIRPPVYCDFCKNVTSFDRLTNVTAETFLKKYAYSTRPLLLEGYQKVISDDGRAFDFDFIKSLYSPDSPSLANIHPMCEYQPKYGLGDFPTLGEMMNMSHEKQHAHRSNVESPWYVGWINCDREVTQKYTDLFLPLFLPNSSERSRTFWTFMGTPGLGFSMHIDPTFHPQWHTQIYGQKKWTLEPPPECYFQCPNAYFDVTMQPGDTIVFHNGMWFHETENVGEDLSIGVAAEYD